VWAVVSATLKELLHRVLPVKYMILNFIVNGLELCVEDVKRERLDHVHLSRILLATKA
jgi:hypothetical protein